MADEIKLGFVLLSNTQNPIPSTRIVVLNMLPYLRSVGFDPHIVFEPDTSTKTPDVTGVLEKIKAGNFKIVVFQKVFGSSVLQLARELRNIGVKTVFAICDFVNPTMCEATDATIVVTDYLKGLYPRELQSRIAVVHDGVERPERQKTRWSNHTGSRAMPLKTTLVTSAALDHLPLLTGVPDWLKVTIVGRYSARNLPLQRWKENYWEMVEKNDWSSRWRYICFLANQRIQCDAWGADSVYGTLEMSDFGIIPIEPNPITDPTGEWRLKSENRLTLKMAIGLPVVATPIPSYEAVIEQGVNGFLARSTNDWAYCLSVLRDPDARQVIGKNARDTALSRYSQQYQAQRLIKVLRWVVSGGTLQGNCLGERPA